MILAILVFLFLIPQDISEGQGDRLLDLVYFPQTTGTINGVVIDAQDRPIANASVSAHRHTNQPASRNDRTDIIADQGGHFVFSGVAPGTYTVVAFKDPQYPDSSFFGISETYAKRAQRTITIEAGQTVDGVEKGDGFGSGFTFTNKISQHSFRTGGSVDGKSERWLPPNIPFWLTVEARGHQAQKFDIELKPDEPLELNRARKHWHTRRYGTGSGSDRVPVKALSPPAPGRYRSRYCTNVTWFDLEVIMVQSDPKFGTLEVYVTDENGKPETGTLILMIKENEQSAKFGIPLDPFGFRRYFIPPDTPFWFEVNVGGRAIFHSRTVRGEEWIQLKSGEVMTVRYPFTVR